MKSKDRTRNAREAKKSKLIKKKLIPTNIKQKAHQKQIDLNKRHYNDKEGEYLTMQHEDCLLSRKQFVSYMCPHDHIGASLVLTLLKGNLSLSRQHSYMNTPFEKRVLGSKGETAFRTKNTIYLDHPFGISTQIPFICATPDFIIKNENEFVLVEVKTHSSLENAKAMFTSLPIETMMQVWIASDIFKINKIKLVIYFVTQKSVVNLFGTIFITKKINFFDDEELCQLVFARYMEYMKFYLKFNKIESQHTFEKLRNRVINSNKPSKSDNKHIKRLVLNWPIKDTCKNEFHIDKPAFGMHLSDELKGLNINTARPESRNYSIGHEQQATIKEIIMKSSSRLLKRAARSVTVKIEPKSRSNLTRSVTLKKKNKTLFKQKNDKIETLNCVNKILYQELLKYKTAVDINQLLATNKNRKCLEGLDEESIESIEFATGKRKGLPKYLSQPVGYNQTRRKRNVIDISESSGEELSYTGTVEEQR